MGIQQQYCCIEKTGKQRRLGDVIATSLFVDSLSPSRQILRRFQ